MAPWQIFVPIAILIAVAIAVEAWLKRNRPRRPLADLMDDPDGAAPRRAADGRPKPELGMEATDIEVVHDALRANRAASMMRDNSMGKNNPFATFRARRPRAMPNDETYAKLYYNAFRKPGRGEKK